MVNRKHISKSIDDAIIKCASSSIRRIGSNYTITTTTIPDKVGETIIGESKKETITYSNGVQVSFIEKDYFDENEFDFQSITIDGQEHEYLGHNSYSFFDYQKQWIIDHYGESEWDFVSKYADYFASTDGMEVNYDLRHNNPLGEDNFLRREHEHFLNIVRDCPCDRESSVSIRVVDSLHRNDGISKKIISDKAHTSTSVGTRLSDLIDNFTSTSDAWKIITVVDKNSGAKGFFFGNGIKETTGFDWERELHFLPNQEFERLVIDEDNKIIIQKPIN